MEWIEQQPWRPFCSKRCRLIDLGKWAGEEHRIPAEKQAADDNTADEPPH